VRKLRFPATPSTPRTPPRGSEAEDLGAEDEKDSVNDGDAANLGIF
jgi:hypothetical protein